jgi:hypothetical protein
LEEKKRRKWYWRVLDFVNPLRDPSLTVAAVLTFIEEAGQHNPWYIIIVIALVNWIAVRGVVWLVVNFTFAAVFLSRRIWWSAKHPRLAWRILDAVGHEEIVIGGNAAMTNSIVLQDGTTLMSPMLGASGVQIIGELPAGTELPLLGMPNGQMPSTFDAPGFFPGSNEFPANGFAGQPSYQQAGNNGFNNEYMSTQSTDGLSQGFSQRPSQEEERLRQQIAAFTRLMDDWVQFTEEKWRTISDSQLGWKPLRGRYGNWDDIFNDVYAAKTSDPMAEAAQEAGEATARRYDTSRDKGSAASAVACFMRDMMTLRRGLDILQQSGSDASPETPNAQPSVQPMFNKRFGNTSGSLTGNTTGSLSPRNTLIRRPAQIFVDADSKK